MTVIENHHQNTIVVVIATVKLYQWMLKLLGESLRIRDLQGHERQGKKRIVTDWKRLRRLTTNYNVGS